MALSSVLKGLMRHCLPGYAQNPQTRLWYEINADDGNGSHNLDHEHVNGALPHDDVHEGEPSMAGVLSTEGDPHNHGSDHYLDMGCHLCRNRSLETQHQVSD